jgi:hypothetical protein
MFRPTTYTQKERASFWWAAGISFARRGEILGAHSKGKLINKKKRAGASWRWAGEMQVSDRRFAWREVANGTMESAKSFWNCEALGFSLSVLPDNGLFSY